MPTFNFLELKPEVLDLYLRKYLLYEIIALFSPTITYYHLAG